MQEMMDRLLAKMEANQREMRVMQKKIDANQIKADATLKEIWVGQEQLEEEMLAMMEARIGANQEKMDAWVAELRTWRKEIMTFQEATEISLESKEPTSSEVESDAEHEEVPKNPHCKLLEH
jgi:hypothetical protein